MYRVTVVRRDEASRRTTPLGHMRVAAKSDVKEWDGHLVIDGCAFDWERTMPKPMSSIGEPPVTVTHHQPARVTIFPPGEWLRVDIVEITT